MLHTADFRTFFLLSTVSCYASTGFPSQNTAISFRTFFRISAESQSNASAVWGTASFPPQRYTGRPMALYLLCPRSLYRSSSYAFSPLSREFTNNAMAQSSSGVSLYPGISGVRIRILVQLDPQTADQLIRFFFCDGSCFQILLKEGIQNLIQASYGIGIDMVFKGIQDMGKPHSLYRLPEIDRRIGADVCTVRCDGFQLRPA